MTPTCPLCGGVHAPGGRHAVAAPVSTSQHLIDGLKHALELALMSDAKDWVSEQLDKAEEPLPPEAVADWTAYQREYLLANVRPETRRRFKA